MNLTPLINALIGLASVIITVYLIPLIRQKTSEEKLNKIKTIINTAVLAAEQIYRGSGKGYEKKQYVIEYLKEKGYVVDIKHISNEIDILIESAVYELNK